MNRLREVNERNVRDPNVVPPTAGISLRGLSFRPFEIAVLSGRATVWGLGPGGNEIYTHLEHWPGLKVEGTTEPDADGGRQVAVSFDYYKEDPGTGYLEQQRRLALLDPEAPFAYGVLLPATENDAPTGHEGEVPTWYFRARKLGSIGAAQTVDVQSLARDLQPDVLPNSFSLARVMGGPIGNPLDAEFRETMGIPEVSLPPDFQQ